MATNGRHSGMLRTDYETDRARLDDFPALECDWQQELCRLGEASGNIRYRENDTEGTLGELYANQVLTVLVEVMQEKTPASAHLLLQKFGGWIDRLSNYLSRNWTVEKNESPSAQVARLIKDQLEKALPAENETHERSGYRMLRTIGYIQEHTGYYLDRIEDSGDMDAALSLLLVYIRNYCHIARNFNGRFASLPELYRKQVLLVRPAGAVKNDVPVVVVQEEPASPLQCAEVNAVFITRTDGKATGIRKQSVAFQDPDIIDTLFSDAHSETLSPGWQLESSMLVLGEGKREVGIRFRLVADEALTGYTLPPHSFTLQLSTAEGWTEQPHTCRIDTNGTTACLCFDFILTQEAAAPTPCTEEVHGTPTTHPALRLLASADGCLYDRASPLKFDAVEIRTNVNGIRNFAFCNELGEVDTTQPFYPFGSQAEKGTWFTFGSEEAGRKPLEEVRLKGIWKKLPETEAGFDKIYKEYAGTEAIGAGSFLIATDRQEDSCWTGRGDSQHLFIPDNGENRSLERAELVFTFPGKQVQRMGNGLFRVTLQAPGIGFGTEAYRALFSERMIYNSHCKEKHRKAIPSAPVIPMLADAELSYIACEKAGLAEIGSASIILTRITALSAQETFPIGSEREQPFLPAAPTDHLLYFAFAPAEGEQTVRMYLDMALPREKIPFYNPQPDKNVKLEWTYWLGTGWLPVPARSVIADETCGLTQSGFVEIRLPKKISSDHTDRRGRAWIRAAVTGDVDTCLAIRSVRTNCIRLTATDDDGLPLPAETETTVAVRQASRISNRHRAIMIKDYEQLVLEHFPEVDKVQCIPVPQEQGASGVCLVVFSRAEDARYYLSPSWKLTEIRRFVQAYAPPFVILRVVNPVYEPVDIHCRAVLWNRVQNEGKAIRQLVVLAQNYLSPWVRKKEMPALRQLYSYKKLHARMVNHEDLMKLVTLEVDGKSLPCADIDTDDLTFGGKHPWSVLLPKIKIELLSPHSGIDEAEIGGNFIIG